MMHGNRVAPLTNATNATANANFDALPSYESYDLAWLGYGPFISSSSSVIVIAPLYDTHRSSRWATARILPSTTHTHLPMATAHSSPPTPTTHLSRTLIFPFHLSL